MTSVDLVDLEALAKVVRRRLPTGTSAASRSRARRLLVDGVLATPDFGDHNCSPAYWEHLWADLDDRRRSRYVHGFLFLGDLPAHLAAAGPADRAGAEYVLDLLQRWDELYQPESWQPMAYHDETTAQRLISTMAVLPHLEALGPAAAFWLQDFLDRTGDLLALDSFHAGPNNHGMFQDIALLTYAALAGWRPVGVRRAFLSKADERLMRYFRESFTVEGVHVENAPNYHILVARHLKEHRDLSAAVGLPHADELGESLRRAVAYATHAVTPSGDYPLVSDTQPTSIAPVARGVFGDAGFVYAATGGAQGTAPQERALVLPHSGYAIYRSAWGDPDATYVYFSAAYNSGYHKHSDENSFWLRSGGRDLLAEAGPNGYAYADPFTRFAYSQHAHNTLVVDGHSTPRTDDRAGEVSLTCDYEGPDGLRVVGRNGRHHDAVHERTLEIAELGNGPTWLRVTDVVTASAEHVYDIFWHVGPDLDVTLRPDGFDLTHEGRPQLGLTFVADRPVALTVHVGEGPPRPLGWRFPRFGQPVPSPVVRMRLSGADARVASTIDLLHEGPRAPGPAATSRSADGGRDDLPGDLAQEPEVQIAADAGDEPGGGSISASMFVEGARQYAFKLYLGSAVVAEVPYSADSEVRWTGLGKGRYRVRGYARERAGDEPVAHDRCAVAGCVPDEGAHVVGPRPPVAELEDVDGRPSVVHLLDGLATGIQVEGVRHTVVPPDGRPDLAGSRLPKGHHQSAAGPAHRRGSPTGSVCRPPG